MAPILVKSLSRLSRDSLLDLCLKWTKSSKCTPYLASNRKLHESEEEDYLHEPADSIDDLNDLYVTLKENVFDLSKREIIDRIVDGDWRRGLSFQQLATLDFAHLEQNDTALRWSALQLVPMQNDVQDKGSQHPAKRRKVSHNTRDDICYPDISPASFLESLKAQVSPLVKAHYFLHRLPAPLDLTIVRLYIVPNTSFAPRSANILHNSKTALDSARVMYIALPRSCPYIYVSVSGASPGSKPKVGSKPDTNKVDIATAKRIVLEAIPKALSKPQQRWSWESMKLTAKSLQSIASLRGSGRPGTSGGAYAKFNADQESNQLIKESETTSQGSKTSSIADIRPTTVQQHQRVAKSSHESKIEDRFGPMSGANHASLDRVQVTVQDILQTPAQATTRSSRKRRRRMTDIEDSSPNEQEEYNTGNEPAPVIITFSGTDVFKGLKTLALQYPGSVDMDRLPAWMTGEKNMSSLTV